MRFLPAMVCVVGLACGGQPSPAADVKRAQAAPPDDVDALVIALGKMREAIGGYEAVSTITLEQYLKHDGGAKECTAEERQARVLGKFLWREAKHVPGTTTAFLSAPVGQAAKHPFGETLLIDALSWTYAFDGSQYLEKADRTAAITGDPKKAKANRERLYYNLSPLGLAFLHHDIQFQGRKRWVRVRANAANGVPTTYHIPYRWSRFNVDRDDKALIGVRAEFGDWKFAQTDRAKQPGPRDPEMIFQPETLGRAWDFVLNPRWAFLPVEVIHRTNDPAFGKVVRITTVEDAVEIRPGVWFPIKGTCRDFHKDTVWRKFTLAVDPGSIKIHQDYNPADFKVDLDPRMPVYDRDAKTAKINPDAVEGQLNKAVDVKGKPEVKGQ